MNGLLTTSSFFGVTLSLLTYLLGMWLKKKFKFAFLNPLLIAIVVTMLVLVACHIDYETYNEGAKYLSYLLTPATVCLAIPLYEQLEQLKRHWKAVPYIDRAKCVKCMRCRDGCPVRPPAIDPAKAAVANPAVCIKCYCCHEFCPVKAISVNPTFLERFILTPRLRTLAARLAGAVKR